ncbi:MAG TPA: hypothetical protein VG014_10360 [Acidimicrobiales bacterium]|jgi:hypothetical protein|nr:hypothetical protein [Acidimicrobiales bacterium]
MKLRRQARAVDQAQAMLLVVALIGVLVAVPVAINVLAVGQAPTSEQAALVVQARQAATAGISDYINRVENTVGYTQYCSTGMSKWTCPGATFPPPATNPAFVNSPTLVGQWYTDGVTMRGVANGTPSYRYVVNSPNTANPALVTIYSIGQAGTQSGLHASSTEEAALTVCGAGCLTPVTATTCIKVPTGAVSAKVVAYGAAGAGGGTDASGGVGALVTATVPVVAGHTLYLIPGQPGVPGNTGLLSLLGLINIFPGAGGAGGSGNIGSCSLLHPNAPPDLGGGNGALPGVGAPPLYTGALTSGGGGGGGATAVYDSTAGSMVVAAGGGGGGGAGNLLSLLGLDPPGAGGKGGNPPAAGANTPGILFLLGGSPGGKGGLWTAGGAVTCASGAAGDTCGQNGYTPPVLAGVATGGGGGGGGGYQSSVVGGGGGGTTGGVVGILGSGAGGGAGTSLAAPGCTSSIGPVVSYPAGDTTQAGQVSISFYSGVVGSCASTSITTVTGTIRASAAP